MYPILSIIPNYSSLKFLIIGKKSGLTIVEQAIVLVPEFENVVRKLEQRVTLREQSKSTFRGCNRITYPSYLYNWLINPVE